MDIVEYAEMLCDRELPEWQKNHLRTLYDLSRKGDIHIVMRPKQGFYTFMKSYTLKELTQNGETLTYNN